MVRVGSLAGCLGEHCHHLQALLVEVSPCSDPKPKCAIPFHLPAENILRAGRWIELLWPLPYLELERSLHFPLQHSSSGDRALLLPSGHCVDAREAGLEF